MANERRQAKLDFGEHRRRSLKTPNRARKHRFMRRRDRAWLPGVTSAAA